MADKYTFTGYGQTGYPQYTDLSTDRMLIAEPGGIYGIRTTEEGFPVPPGDGRWVPATAPPPGAPVSARPPVIALAAPEGGAA